MPDAPTRRPGNGRITLDAAIAAAEAVKARRPAPFDPTGSVRVLGYDYDVKPETRDTLQREDGTHHMGRSLIRVDVENAPDHVRQVTLHELTHAVDDAFDVGLNEKQIHRVARGFYALCRDNPEYMRALLFPDE